MTATALPALAQQAVTAARPNTDRHETGALHEAHTWTTRLFSGPGGIALTDVAMWCPGWPVVP